MDAYVDHHDEFLCKKKFKKSILEFSLECSKVKIFNIFVIHHFLYVNNIILHRFRAQMKAKGEFYNINKTNKQIA